jgi:hypothetical protein
MTSSVHENNFLGTFWAPNGHLAIKKAKLFRTVLCTLITREQVDSFPINSQLRYLCARDFMFFASLEKFHHFASQVDGLKGACKKTF